MIFDKDLSVLGCRKEGISLPLPMIEHCLAKKELNNLAFSLKLVANLFSSKIGGIQGIFLLLWKDFSTDQYLLGLVDGYINFLDKREYLCLDVSMETPNKF